MEKVLEGTWEVLGAEKKYELAINSDGQTFSVKVQMVNSVTHVGHAICYNFSTLSFYCKSDHR